MLLLSLFEYFALPCTLKVDSNHEILYLCYENVFWSRGKTSYLFLVRYWKAPGWFEHNLTLSVYDITLYISEYWLTKPLMHHFDMNSNILQVYPCDRRGIQSPFGCSFPYLNVLSVLRFIHNCLGNSESYTHKTSVTDFSR